MTPKCLHTVNYFQTKHSFINLSSLSYAHHSSAVHMHVFIACYGYILYCTVQLYYTNKYEERYNNMCSVILNLSESHWLHRVYYFNCVMYKWCRMFQIDGFNAAMGYTDDVDVDGKIFYEYWGEGKIVVWIIGN